jgi:5-hydroxyisourate hydrolase
MITTHVLDTALGRPAAGVEVVLRRRGGDGGEWLELGRGATDADGRSRTLYPLGAPLEPGVYSLTFGVGAYHRARGVAGFYPEATIVFEIVEPGGHYHVPLLLSPFGYSTYRGS